LTTPQVPLIGGFLRRSCGDKQGSAVATVKATVYNGWRPGTV